MPTAKFIIENGAYPKPRQTIKCDVRTYFRLEGAIDATIQALKEKAESIASRIK